MERKFLVLLFWGAISCALLNPHCLYADFHPGVEGHAAFIQGDSGQNVFESPAWGGSTYLYYSPSIFFGFVGFGPRVSYTKLESKTPSQNSAELWDGLLGFRLSYDELLENFVLDIQLEGGASYFDPAVTTGGDSSLHFSYALGGRFRYHLLPRTSVGFFGRWQQAIGTMKPSTDTTFKNLNFFETGVLLELFI
ncbi:MAG: hypothetical protein HYS98_06465 [Deltaproteobacteria bacterium]|nr:hypothetical protein [Deltaproteobacteria bacterium]